MAKTLAELRNMQQLEDAVQQAEVQLVYDINSVSLAWCCSELVRSSYEHGIERSLSV